MKLFSGLLVLFLAILISGVAAYFSVIGLAALFSAAFLPVVIMGTSLEAGKLAAAQWLKSNWHNEKVGIWHKTYLMSAVFVLMVITGLGIYGFLSKGHLEQNAPLAGVELQISQKEQQISVLESQNERLNEKLRLLDSSLDVYLKNDRATLAVKERANQREERKIIEDEIDANFARMQEINAEILPLRLQTSEVEAKLGPIKYVADLLELEDPEAAVRAVILLLMFAFDPLAIVLLLSGTMTLNEYFEQRRTRKEKERQEAKEEARVAKMEKQQSIEQPKVETSEPLILNDIHEKNESVIDAIYPETVKDIAPVMEEPEENIQEEIIQPTDKEIDLMREIVQSGVMPDDAQKEIVPVIRKAEKRAKRKTKKVNEETPVETTEVPVMEEVESVVEPTQEAIDEQPEGKSPKGSIKDFSWLNAGK